MMCSGYCPTHSECVDGLFKCKKGFKGFPALGGCEGELIFIF